VGAVLCFGLFALVGYLTAPPVAGNWGQTFKAIGVAVAVGSGVFAPITSIVMAKYQSQLTVDLENMRGELNAEIEALKFSLSAGLEIRKVIISGKMKALDSMLTTAHFYYYVNRQLAFHYSDNVEQLLVDADQRAAEASSLVWHLDAGDRLRWFEVYQRSINLSLLLKECEIDERPDIFDANVGKLGEAIDALELVARVAFSENDALSGGGLGGILPSEPNNVT
jgi:hypothetical protein